MAAARHDRKPNTAKHAPTANTNNGCLGAAGLCLPFMFMWHKPGIAYAGCSYAPFSCFLSYVLFCNVVLSTVVLLSCIT